MKKLLCLVMCCLMFGLVLYNVDLVYAEEEFVKLNYKPLFLNDEDKQIYNENWNNKLTVKQYEKFKKEHGDFLMKVVAKGRSVFEEYLAKIDMFRKKAETDPELKKAVDIYDRIENEFGPGSDGDYNELVKLVDECVAIRPIGDVHLMKVRYYLMSGDYKGLLDWLNKFDDKEERTTIKFYYWKAVAYYNLGNYNKALEYCDKGIQETDPQKGELYICRGFISRKLGDEKKYTSNVKLGMILIAFQRESENKKRK